MILYRTPSIQLCSADNWIGRIWNDSVAAQQNKLVVGRRSQLYGRRTYSHFLYTQRRRRLITDWPFPSAVTHRHRCTYQRFIVDEHDNENCVWWKLVKFRMLSSTGLKLAERCDCNRNSNLGISVHYINFQMKTEIKLTTEITRSFYSWHDLATCRVMTPLCVCVRRQAAHVSTAPISLPTSYSMISPDTTPVSHSTHKQTCYSRDSWYLKIIRFSHFSRALCADAKGHGILSVRLSVYPSQSWSTSKRFKISKYISHHTIVWRF